MGVDDFLEILEAYGRAHPRGSLPWDDPNADIMGDIRKTLAEARENWWPGVSNRRKTMAFDFDGVIHKYSGGWQDGSVYDDIDVTGIRMAHERGFAVAVMTSRDVTQVAQVLMDHDFAVKIDDTCSYTFWNGLATGEVVLVTNRKIAAVAYIDDRGVNFQWGADWSQVLDKAYMLSKEAQIQKGKELP